MAIQSDSASRLGRAFLVGLDISRRSTRLDIESSLAELALLADTAGLEVVGQVYQSLPHPNPATFIGSGKVDEIRAWVKELSADIVLFDDELTPRHLRVLEEDFGENVRVVDRTALILDIFAQHARTKEGVLQVELAQYEYRLPRLTRQWTHLIRQAGGSSGRGGVGGVGLRGPGETQLESDRREVRKKIGRLKLELERVRGQRAQHRRQRQQRGIPTIALVGYTNAGKSTLLNRLSGSAIYTADQLFATLDPTTRRVTLDSGQDTLFSDTVGFIQKLPHTLVAAFQATLEEIAEANILVHVMDASHPNVIQQADVVEHTLVKDLEITNTPIIRVANKADLSQDIEPDTLKSLYQTRGALPISALQGWGIDSLLSEVSRRISSNRDYVTVRIGYDHADVIARFHHLALLDSEVHEAASVVLAGRIEPRFLEYFSPYVVR